MKFCKWGTHPFAHLTATGEIFSLHFKLVFESNEYKENTQKFYLLAGDKKFEELQQHYEKWKQLYKGSVEWDARFPVMLHKISVIGK